MSDQKGNHGEASGEANKDHGYKGYVNIRSGEEIKFISNFESAIRRKELQDHNDRIIKEIKDRYKHGPPPPK
jgi:hypothetical protein